jgi:hypothetical protein
MGVSSDPNAATPANYVPGSRMLAHRYEVMHERLLTQDGGLTLPEERLAALSHIGDGRSGLKKRAWYMQLPGVEVPFHSSALRWGADMWFNAAAAFLRPECGKHVQASLCNPRRRWVVNATGSAFDARPDAPFRHDLAAVARSANVGQAVHHGIAVPASVAEVERMALKGDARELLHAAIAAQFYHAVHWADSLDEMIGLGSDPAAKGAPTAADASHVAAPATATEPRHTCVEIAPGAPVLADLVRRAFRGIGSVPPSHGPANVEAFTFPNDADKMATAGL